MSLLSLLLLYEYFLVGGRCNTRSRVEAAIGVCRDLSSEFHSTADPF